MQGGPGKKASREPIYTIGSLLVVFLKEVVLRGHEAKLYAFEKRID